jgi:hypothetical protein
MAIRAGVTWVLDFGRNIRFRWNYTNANRMPPSMIGPGSCRRSMETNSALERPSVGHSVSRGAGVYVWCRTSTPYGIPSRIPVYGMCSVPRRTGTLVSAGAERNRYCTLATRIRRSRSSVVRVQTMEMRRARSAATPSHRQGGRSAPHACPIRVIRARGLA